MHGSVLVSVSLAAPLEVIAFFPAVAVVAAAVGASVAAANVMLFYCC